MAKFIFVPVLGFDSPPCPVFDDPVDALEWAEDTHNGGVGFDWHYDKLGWHAETEHVRCSILRLVV